MSSPAYEGGSGGYIKRQLFKNSTRTPYERPPSAARGVRSTATVKGNDGRLLPTFMEPVSRFIARTASRLLSSVLPKRLSAQSGAEEKHLVKALLSHLHRPKLRRDGKCYETSLWILPKAYSSLLGSHGLTIIEIVGVAALAVDMLHFDITSQVPTGLSQYVSSSNSKEEQASWHNKLLKAWNEDWPPPKQPEVAPMLVIQALYIIVKANFEGFLAFSGLSYIPQTIEEDVEVTTTWPEGITPPWPEGVQFELLTLPVDKRAIGDGYGFTVYVNITEPRELKLLPQKIIDAIIMKENACDVDFKLEKLIKKSVIASGYRFLKLPNQQEVLARKYRTRLRGVDAPELGMAFGDEAKQILVKMIQGKCLKIHVYSEDIYGQSVGDVYCNDIFIQEQLLKRGCVWHYVAYDGRPKFAKWQKEARDARRGLWALPDPEKPWEWRKNNPNPREHQREAPILFTDSDSVGNTWITKCYCMLFYLTANGQNSDMFFF